MDLPVHCLRAPHFLVRKEQEGKIIESHEVVVHDVKNVESRYSRDDTTCNVGSYLFREQCDEQRPCRNCLRRKEDCDLLLPESVRARHKCPTCTGEESTLVSDAHIEPL